APSSASGNPTELQVAGDSGVFATFAGQGLLRRDPGSGNWATLTPNIPLQIEAGGNCDLGGIFNSTNQGGLYQWTRNNGNWMHVESPTFSSGFTGGMAGGDAGVFASFTGQGLMWQDPSSGSWSTLTPNIPTLMQVDSNGNLWAVFDSSDMRGL